MKTPLILSPFELLFIGGTSVLRNHKTAGPRCQGGAAFPPKPAVRRTTTGRITTGWRVPSLGVRKGSFYGSPRLEERSFTRGARRLHLGQSAASSAVSRLERELGLSLLTRTTRSVTPTDAGLAVYRRALQILATQQDIHDDLDSFRAGERGTVIMGLVLSTGTIDISGVLTGLRHSHPGLVVHLRFIPGSAETRHEPLLEGTVDLAIVPMSPTVIAEVSVRPIARTTMSLVCRRDNPLTWARGVRLGELEHHEFIDFPKGWGNRVIIDALFARHQASRSVVVEVTEVNTALTLILNSLGIAFLPSDVALPAELARVDLAEAPPSITLGLASAAQRPMSAAASIVARAIVAHGHHSRQGRPGAAVPP